MNFHASICQRYFNFVKNLPKPVVFNLTKKLNQSPWNVNLESKGPNFARKMLQRPFCINSSILKAVCAKKKIVLGERMDGLTDERTGRKQYPHTTSLRGDNYEVDLTDSCQYQLFMKYLLKCHVVFINAHTKCFQYW